MSTLIKRIALFGLSANPPTGLLGHQGIVQLLTSCGKFDEVWILPVYAHIFSSKRHLLVDYDDRVRMCELAFSCEASERCTVCVSRIEKELAEHHLSLYGPESRVGTVDLLEYLVKKDSERCDGTHYEYYLVVGMDAVCDMAVGKWKNVQRILEIAHLALLERIGYSEADPTTQEFLQKYQSVILRVAASSNHNHELGEISSTFLREILAGDNNSSLDDNLIHPSVVEYIKSRHLYQK